MLNMYFDICLLITLLSLFLFLFSFFLVFLFRFFVFSLPTTRHMVATANSRNSPLSVAVRDGHEATVNMLLARKDVDVNQATTDTGSTALNMCCIVGTINICKMLLAREEIDVNKTMKNSGATPLYTALDFTLACISF